MKINLIPWGYESCVLREDLLGRLDICTRRNIRKILGFNLYDTKDKATIIEDCYTLFDNVTRVEALIDTK